MANFVGVSLASRAPRAVKPPTRLGPPPPRSAQSAPNATATERPKGPNGENGKRPPGSITVRTGHHQNYGRLVFGWSRKVGFTVNRNGQAVTIRFDKPGKIDIEALRRELPVQIIAAIQRRSDKGLEIGLVVPPDAQLRYFHNKTDVVFDVVARRKKPLSNKRTANANQNAKSKSARIASTKKIKRRKKKRRRPALPFVSVQASRKGVEATLRFNWRRPVSAAVFRRDASIWIVFDRAARIDLGPIRVISDGLFKKVEQYSADNQVQVRLPMSSAFRTAIRREGTIWILETGPRSMRAARSNTIQIEASRRP